MENTEIKTKKPMGYWSNRFVYGDAYKWTFLKWTTINQRTVNGKYAKAPSVCANPQQISYLKHNITINMTQEEFFDYCARNENKIHSMIEAGERPSIDRICPACDYSIENIQIIPLLDNMTKDSNPDGIKLTYDKTRSHLINRLMYIRSHSQYSPLIIDDYLLHWKLRFVVEAIKLGLIPDAFAAKTEMLVESKATDFLNAKQAEFENKITESAKKKQELVLARKAKVEKLTEKKQELEQLLKDKKDIEAKKVEIQNIKSQIKSESLKKKQELEQFHADKDWIKTQPRYAEVKLATSSVLRPNVLYGVDIEGLTPTRATIKILHHLHNPLL